MNDEEIMKITEFIEELQKILDKEGDIYVRILHNGVFKTVDFLNVIRRYDENGKEVEKAVELFY